MLKFLDRMPVQQIPHFVVGHHVLQLTALE
ncbi:Uncharacterised protein [Mycobacteroides abscessus subsp. abscessus]|nr:Uncharacterised protein [Mycobacteroides abscessus subsp. abscessus]SKW18956.1 Uncharacterised protein [Mycobacteroides abscessus subsp. abscessus]